MSRKLFPSSHLLVRVGFISPFVAVLVLHLWGLGRFNRLVFDEIYYVPFALDYLNQTPSFDAHPPLGKYLIALGIWLGHWPAAWFDWPTLVVEGQSVSPISYRWLNGLFGATLPGLAAVLAAQISAAYPPRRRWAFSLLAGLLMALNGLTLAESRLALINLYWLWFGLLGQCCWLQARLSSSPWRWRLGAGMALGAAINVKWNGAGFWLGLVLWELGRKYWPSIHTSIRPGTLPLHPHSAITHASSPVLPRPLPWSVGMIYLGLVPLITYSLLWLPHLALTGESLLGMHRRLWALHQAVGTGLAVHPYCSAWYTWPLMLRPVAYLYEWVGRTPPPDVLAAPRPAGVTVFTIQGMGNPILWWLATAAVLAIALGQGSRWLSRRRSNISANAPDRPVETFLLVNYVASWLPWLLVSRCTFLYHSMGLILFSHLALAWLLSRWWLDRHQLHRGIVVALVTAVALSFWFWLPLYLGLPLSPEALQARWWLKSWI